jgi:hypothetical protein
MIGLKSMRRTDEEWTSYVSSARESHYAPNILTYLFTNLTFSWPAFWHDEAEEETKID